MEKVPKEMLPDAGRPMEQDPASMPSETSHPLAENAPGRLPEQTSEEPGLTREQVAAMVDAAVPTEDSRDASATPSNIPPSVARTLCSELVEVECHDGGEAPLRTTANLEEIWHTGATLEMESPVTEGMRLTILRPPMRLAARVLYCQQNLTGFGVGVQFAEGSFWTLDQFIPGHSLNLEDLARNASNQDESPADEDHPQIRPLDSAERRLEEDLLRELPPSVRGIHRSGKAFLGDLSPLIARGSLMRLREQMMPGKA
jgi:hypothetical protein